MREYQLAHARPQRSLGMRRRHIALLQPLEVHIGAEGVLKLLGLASYGLKLA